MPRPPLAPGFMIVHGNQPEWLRQLLVHWFRAHPLAPLEDEAILVQSNGIAQWLKHALAESPRGEGGGCGIAASLDLLLPSRFVWRAYRAVLGRDAVPETSPFDKPLLIWRLMRLLPTLTDSPGFEPLARFLADDADLRRRYQLAEKIADLFDQYQVYRADWLDAWAGGEEVLLNARGERLALEAGQRWQPRLWRALLADVGAAAATSNRATVHRRFLDAAAKLDTPPPGLPRRISLFGLSSLPRQSLEVLLALSRFTQVVLCVNNPCEHYWTDLLSARDHARRDFDQYSSTRHAKKPGVPDAPDDNALHLYAHPLLASWGRQVRDYLALLDELDQPEAYRERFAAIGERIDLFQPHGDATLLNQLQDDIRTLRPLAEARALDRAVDPARDDSIRFHAVHSPQREIEVLHDQLLAAFSADPTLKPRDIIVMLPDVDTYAPHIDAVFGQLAPDDDRFIPYSIADQTTRRRAPVAVALEALLGVPDARLTVTEVFDLFDVAAVRQKFGFDADDLPLLRRWIEGAGIRWGLDARHREAFVPQGHAQNTWAAGLERMLLGYAVGDDPTGRMDLGWHDIEPYGEVGGLDAVLAGRLARFLQALGSLATRLAAPATPADWGTRLADLLNDFFAGDTPDDLAVIAPLQQSLADWVDACAAADLAEPLPLAVVREHWLAELDQPTLAQRFLAGRLTFATLMPMRAIPFRIVCLAGMRDGDFPRSRPPLDFDLMARDARPGDRSRREDDRTLFLEALLSARERLIVSWVGRDVRDNTPAPPSVLVAQLRDHLDAAWSLAPDAESNQIGHNLVDALTQQHRLQPFDSAYLAGDDPRWFTYAREWEGREAAAPAQPGPLPAPAFDAPITLAQLGAFLANPTKSFFRERLGVAFAGLEIDQHDHEPFELDGLEQWALQDELIAARLDAVQHGTDADAAVARTLERQRRRGDLPIGALGHQTAEHLVEPLPRQFELYAAARATWPAALEPALHRSTHVVDGQSVELEGELTGRYANADGHAVIRVVSTSLLDKKTKQYRRDKLLHAWVQHLAAQTDTAPTTTRLIGKNGEIVLQPVAADQARAWLDTLVGAYVEGQRRPLPVAPQAAYAWLFPPKAKKDDDRTPAERSTDAARKVYDDGYDTPGEVGRSAELAHVWPDFGTLWSAGEFAHWADTLYAPLETALGAAKQNEGEA